MRGLAVSAAALALLGVAASAGAAPTAEREPVRFRVSVTVAESNVAARGRFSATGAVRDSGRVVDQLKNVRGKLQIIRKLRGRKGTLRVRVLVNVDTEGRAEGSWRIVAGTGAYRRLRGSGTCWGRSSFGRLRHVMGGRVTR